MHMHKAQAVRRPLAGFAADGLIKRTATTQDKSQRLSTRMDGSPVIIHTYRVYVMYKFGSYISGGPPLLDILSG